MFNAEILKLESQILKFDGRIKRIYEKYRIEEDKIRKEYYNLSSVMLSDKIASLYQIDKIEENFYREAINELEYVRNTLVGFDRSKIEPYIVDLNNPANNSDFAILPPKIAELWSMHTMFTSFHPAVHTIHEVRLDSNSIAEYLYRAVKNGRRRHKV